MIEDMNEANKTLRYVKGQTLVTDRDDRFNGR